VFALAFASANRLFIATTVGHVYRADRSRNRWSLTRLDNVATGPLGLTGLIGDMPKSAFRWRHKARRPKREKAVAGTVGMLKFGMETVYP
jgi:hypothetical protein